MNKRQEIEELQSRIENLKRQISNCRHVWNDAKYDPETVRESYGYKMVSQGSDVWGEPEGFRDVNKHRWSRECNICGHKEYTYTQEVANITKIPKF